MIAIFGFFLMLLAVMGGGLIAQGIWFGFVMAGLSGTAMGTLIAFLQREREVVFENCELGAVTVGDIRDAMVNDDDLVFAMTAQGIQPIIARFECIIDGKRVLVVEPAERVVDEQEYYGIPVRDEEDFI